VKVRGEHNAAASLRIRSFVPNEHRDLSFQPIPLPQYNRSHYE